MKIDRVITGELEENCYILGYGDDVLVIDPGDDYDNINKVINGRNILGILITHNHFDHVGALSYFEDIKVYKYDNLEEKEYNIGPFAFNVIFNPGHSSDSVSYYFKDNKALFCGDFIFNGSIGRWDLPTGNMIDMKNSIDMIKKYPRGIVIYPGHGDNTTLGNEIDNNIYFRE